MEKIYVFRGNDKDKAFVLSKQIKLPEGHVFCYIDDPKVLLEQEETILIMDVIDSVKTITISKDVELLKNRKLNLLKTFNINPFLGLLNSLKVKDIKIIALPKTIKKEELQKFIDNNF